MLISYSRPWPVDPHISGFIAFRELISLCSYYTVSYFTTVRAVLLTREPCGCSILGITANSAAILQDDRCFRVFIHEHDNYSAGRDF